MHDAVARRRSGTTRVAELGFENEILHFLIQVHSALNTNVADLTTTYNFPKGHTGFLSIDVGQKNCQL
jgi:hypothetical protein